MQFENPRKAAKSRLSGASAMLVRLLRGAGLAVTGPEAERMAAERGAMRHRRRAGAAGRRG
jgi:hypothetical protein